MESCSEYTSGHRQEGFQSVRDSSGADLQRRIHDNLNNKSLITSSFQMTADNSSKRVRGYQKTQHYGHQGECSGT